MEPGSVRVVQQAQRTRRKRVPAHEFAGLDDAGAHGERRIGRHRRDVVAEASTLQFACMDGQRRIAEQEATDEVGAAGDGVNRHLLQVIAHPGEEPRRQDRSGRQYEPQRRKPGVASLPLRAIAQYLKEAGARPEHGDFVAADQVELRLRHRVHDDTVVQRDRRPARERRQGPVPHHPAAVRLEIHQIVGTEAGVQPMLLLMLEESAAGAVDDAFRCTGGARRKQHEQRMIERQAGQRGDIERPSVRVTMREVVQGEGCDLPAGQGDRLFVERDRGADARKIGDEPGQPVSDRGRAAAHTVPVMVEEQFRLELPEAVAQGVVTEIGRGGAPEGAQCGARQAGHDGIRRVARDGCNARPGSHTDRCQPAGKLQDPACQLAAADALRRPVFVPAEQREPALVSFVAIS